MPNPADPPKGGLWNNALLLVAAASTGVAIFAAATAVVALRARR